MRMVYSSHNVAMFGIIRDALSERGIEHVIKNEFLQGALGELPALHCWPEIWVMHDEDYTAAMRVLEALNLAKPSENPEPWYCEQCGEAMEGQFTACWQCGAGRYESKGVKQ